MPNQDGAPHTARERFPRRADKDNAATKCDVSGDLPKGTREGTLNRWRPLQVALRDALGGAVRLDLAHQAAYASDASNYRQVPICVVVPSSVDELTRGLAVCHAHRAPVLVRGGGTSMNGQAVNSAVVFDVSTACTRIVDLNPSSRSALVEPGVVCDTLRAAAERHGLTFAPDPSTHSRCTLGGMIGNNSCGPHSVMAGKTLENVEELEVLTYDGARFWVGPTPEERIDEIVRAGGRQGQIYRDLRALRDRYAEQIRQRFPSIKRRVSGFNLDQLLPENGFNVARALVGTEGTCAVVLNARVSLVHSPASRAVLVLGFEDIYAAADAVPEFERLSPIAIEGLDGKIIRGLEARGMAQAEIALLPEGNAWIVLEFGAEAPAKAIAQAERAADYFRNRPRGLRPSTWLVSDPALQARVWSIRENGASATQLSIDPKLPDPKVGWEDAAVDPHRLGGYLREFQALVDRYGYETSLFGHFGDGCVHARVTFDLRSNAGVTKYRDFMREAAELVVAFGGSLSGEHGDGQAKAEFLPVMFGDELVAAMREFKRAWDPDGLLNPGKVIDPYRTDENLRAGPRYKDVHVDTRMEFRSQEGNGFQRAVERCVGMGRCRSGMGGTMCPSFRATRSELHSTRGRARLLWEMLQGEIVHEGWRSEAVKEALDTCLACKGCRSDCPTHADMASYKAEFLSHYYESHRRPRQAWSMGRIADWAPLAGAVPQLSNFLTQTPVLSSLVKWVAGVAPDRDLPRFASRGFRRSHRVRQHGDPEQLPKVILWVDTFCDHFHPEVAEAAVEVLRHAGFAAVLPPTRLCCGRPLYDFGFLDAARARLSNVLDILHSSTAGAPGEGVSVVGLEPGCMSVFKDELLKLFPDDTRARWLSENSFLLGDFLLAHDYVPPPLDEDVLVHAHCHQKSLFGAEGDKALLERGRARVTLLDSGCCGMAGSFGFNRDQVELSRQVGELVLMPAVRRHPSGAVVMTNGFSCREQIRQATGRNALHLAEILARAARRAQPSPGWPGPREQHPAKTPRQARPGEARA